MSVFDWLFEILHLGDLLSAWRFTLLLVAGVSIGWYLSGLLGGGGIGIVVWVVCGLLGAIFGGLWEGQNASAR